MCFSTELGARRLFSDACSTEDVIYDDCSLPQPVSGEDAATTLLLSKVTEGNSKGEVRLD